MGASYTAYTIVGVEIDIDSLTTDDKVRSCSCEVVFDANNPPQFCEMCGEKFMTDEDADVEGFNRDDEQLFGLDLVWNTNQERAFIGKVLLKSGDDDGVEFKQCMFGEPCVDDLSIEIRTKLEPHGFWNKKKFGLYSVLYCSY